MFETKTITTQDKINFLQNTKEYLWVLIGRTLCQLMEKPCPKTGNPLSFYSLFLSILLIWCITNVSKNPYHATGEGKLFAQQKVGLVSVAWENIASAHG